MSSDMKPRQILTIVVSPNIPVSFDSQSDLNIAIRLHETHDGLVLHERFNRQSSVIHSSIP